MVFETSGLNTTGGSPGVLIADVGDFHRIWHEWNLQRLHRLTKIVEAQYAAATDWNATR